MTNKIAGLSELRSRYDAILSDVWGVLHNGHSAFAGAGEALTRFREEGGHVVLITNAPRPAASVQVQLQELGLGPDVYDNIVTSGDVTRDLIKTANPEMFHLGPERDFHLFEGMNVTLTDRDQAKSFVCSGLNDDENETPEDYRSLLSELVERELPMICANPDIVVERGNRLVYCAGALAKMYEEIGGEVLLAGKPHAPIYKAARQKLDALSEKPVDSGRILAIGDGMPTDVKGATDAKLDLLFIAGGIHAVEYGGVDPDGDTLKAFFTRHQVAPIGWQPHLTW